MAWNRLFFTDTDEGTGQLGGGAWLEDISLWPLNPDTREPMLPLLMINSTFLAIPFLPEGMVATVFVSAKATSEGFSEALMQKYTVHQKDELSKLASGHAKVLLHRLSAEERFIEHMPPPITKKYIQLNEFTALDAELESEDDFNGAEFSKQLGRPCWLQGHIYEGSRYFFLAQLLESDIASVSPQHEGIFSGGMGYLFWDNRAKKLSEGSEGGYFLIQLPETSQKAKADIQGVCHGNE